MPNSPGDAHDFRHVEFRRVNKGFMHFSQVSYLSFPIKPGSSALQGDGLPSEPPRKPHKIGISNSCLYIFIHTAQEKGDYIYMPACVLSCFSPVSF